MEGQPNARLARCLVSQWDMFVSTGMQSCEINPWRVTRDGEIWACDFKATFEVPVFRTEDSPVPGDEPTEASGEWGVASAEVQSSDLDEDLRRAGIIIERRGSRMEIRFRRARCKAGAAMLSGFVVLWTGICVGLCYSDAPVLFPIMFGLTDLLMLWGVCDAWFWHGRVRVGQDRLESRTGIFVATTT